MGVSGNHDSTHRSESEREQRFRSAMAEWGGSLDRLAAAYESDAGKRRDLRQEIQLQIWRSLAAFDSRCSLKTWVLRVAHNTAVSYVSREQRWNSRYVSLEELESRPNAAVETLLDAHVDRERALQQIYSLIRTLKPLDRQLMLLWLEDLDAAAIGEVTGLSPANVAMKLHRIRNILAHRFHQEQERRHA